MERVKLGRGESARQSPPPQKKPLSLTFVSAASNMLQKTPNCLKLPVRRVSSSMAAGVGGVEAVGQC